jgi:hypothetical protein
MTREQAEAERDRLQAEHPEATWMVGEADGGWRVLKVGIPSPESPSGTAVAAKPKPPEAPDPRSAFGRNVGPYGGGAL